MKKITFLLVCALATSMTYAAPRNEAPIAKSSMGVISTNSSLFKIFYKSDEHADVMVAITDSDNKVVFEERIRQSGGFTRPYNFSNLPEGEYTIKLDNGSDSMVERVSYRTGKVRSMAQVVALGNNKYALLVAGNESETFSVSVVNEYGETIYSEENLMSGNSAKLFSLQNARGAVSFSITGEDGFSKTISK